LGTEKLDLELPVGVDLNSYSYASSTGKVFHNAKGMKYGE
jgi:hypothetical protein